MYRDYGRIEEFYRSRRLSFNAIIFYVGAPRGIVGSLGLLFLRMPGGVLLILSLTEAFHVGFDPGIPWLNRVLYR